MKRPAIVAIFIFLFSACNAAVPSSTPPPTPPSLATTTQTTVSPTAALSTPTVIPSPVPDVLYVNPLQSLGPISPLIYGSNYGPWLLVSVDMLPAAYDSGVTILRFPAGS